MITTLLRVLGAEYGRPVRRALYLMAVAAVAEGVSYALLIPILQALLGGDPADAWPWLGAFAVAVAIFGVLRYTADLSGFRAGTTLLKGMYHRLGDHLAALPIGWYGPRRLGEVSTLASSGLLQVMGVIAHLLAPLVSASVTPLTIVAVMLAFNWQMGLAALASVPLVVAIQRWTVRWMSIVDADRAERDRAATGRVIEYLQAQPVLRAGGRTVERFEVLDGALREVRRSSRRSTFAALPGALGLGLTVHAAFTALLALGAYLVLAGSAGPAEVLALLVLAARCADPVLSLSELGGQLQAARGELARLDAVLSADPLPEPQDPLIPEGEGLDFDDVTFHRDERRVLDGASFSLPQGGRLAIVGPSGAGKSTVLELLARFHDVDGGAVRWGGVDVRSMGTRSLLAKISVVFQDVHLFDGTIEDNVRLGRPEATAEQVRTAGAAAGLDDVIERLPHGWSTTVGEGGVLLSGGERQRVSIARALLRTLRSFSWTRSRRRWTRPRQSPSRRASID